LRRRRRLRLRLRPENQNLHEWREHQPSLNHLVSIANDERRRFRLLPSLLGLLHIYKIGNDQYL
jgi:hypothetical protein